MEFVTGVRKKETLELSKVLAPESLDLSLIHIFQDPQLSGIYLPCVSCSL